MESSNVELKHLFNQIRNYETSISDKIISLMNYEMKDSFELREAVRPWLGDKSTTITKYGHIGNWNTSNVTDMNHMFGGVNHFNQDIGNWDVGNWDTSNVTNMRLMFYGSKKFNGDIGEWDTSNVTNMSYMFQGANLFDQDISKWNTSNVTNMNWMFIMLIFLIKMLEIRILQM